MRSLKEIVRVIAKLQEASEVRVGVFFVSGNARSRASRITALREYGKR